MPASSLKDMITFFGMTSAEFVSAWKTLSEKDKTDLKTGFENGTLNY
jgi:hypothetical protein